MTDKKEEQKITTEETSSEEKKVEEKKDSKEEISIPKASELKPGMTIRVYQKIKELNLKKEEKERIQYFEGIIIAKKHNSEIGGTITVRRSVNGIGVEKIFPLNLPTITKIEIKKQARVRRAKLYFLKKGHKKKLKETKVS
ncbi:50S ribosomal protein L19 [bacterium]|nr:50S ribosomal protein L19 [bacterium]